MNADYAERSVSLHKKFGGKLGIVSKVPLETVDDLSVAYTPGVAEPCKIIAANPASVFELTMKGNTVAVVTDGSAVLGLGEIGPLAALPVMEGKAILYKKFAGVDAVPICLDTREPEEIIATIKHLAPAFGGIHLEDISAPRCFMIEERLERELDIPVMHDDQHGTAVVVLAALFNALRLVNKRLEDVRVVINGAGAAGLAIGWLLKEAGSRFLTLVDSRGVIAKGRGDLNPWKERLVALFPEAVAAGATLEQAVVGADVLIGVSRPDLFSPEMIRTMAPKAIVFAMANPIPEIMPDLAYEAGAAVVATGRSDLPNQVNNVLAYPGMFLGALRNHVHHFTPAIKLTAARSLAAFVSTPGPEKILPSVFEPKVAETVAAAIV